MYQVTYSLSGRVKRKRYQSETAAKRSIVRWLENMGRQVGGHAILYAPGEAPAIFRAADEVTGIPTARAPDFYQSQQWLRLRYEALQKHGNYCACCGAQGGAEVQLHVDHIKPRSTHPELALCLENLQVLCAACNRGKSNRSSTRW
ncbi:HNH endonuclease [Ferrimonas balearica]|uniref:HNH endonuclease n=1 Tax=Ferrimonas balearica TaxID=44012 RepID=UPI001C9A2A4C|nr:HNH endonuclease signature motif containing protein [Ferrimonas balearica]MBY5920625.1 HNH endonuclease [Ferrimonas balearica]MBY5996690.1 HNH endonuclease [Ferrimonas balearica]